MNKVPWTSVERTMLTYCVDQEMSWDKVSKCVKHLGNTVGREAHDCAAEYSLIRGEWAKKSRVVPTPRKLADEERGRRMIQLKKRIRRREELIGEMSAMAAHPQQNVHVLRLVRAVEKNVKTARIFARPGGLRGWREPEVLLDEDDGFGPWQRPAKRVQKLPPGHYKPVEPFPFVGPMQLEESPSPAPLAALGALSASPPTFLLSVLESIAAHRVAQMFFLEPVTETVAKGYTAAVKQPMCLTEIRRLLHAGEIVSIEQLYRNLWLMLANAFVFNAPGSEVYQSTETLRKVVQRECQPLLIASLIKRLPS
jgi:hypothetical protein